MPRIAVAFAESALRDLEEMLARYVEQGVLEVGDKLVAEVFKQVEHLVDHSDTGPDCPRLAE